MLRQHRWFTKRNLQKPGLSIVCRYDQRSEEALIVCAEVVRDLLCTVGYLPLGSYYRHPG